MTRKEKAVIICDRLEKRYPDARCSLVCTKPHELMIAGRLSAQCTDARVNIVTKELFEKYKTVDDFASADIADIERIIMPCGLYKTKAQSIVGMCKKLISDFNGEIPKTIDELTTLPGIGRKTANLIMGDVHHKPAIVTDTHCIRICGRLGLSKSKEPAKVEQELLPIVPKERSSDFCHRLVMFGRDVCKARGEKCSACEMTDICTYYRSKQKVKKGK